MDREDVNELILEKVDEIEDNNIRYFVDDILRFERSQLNLKRPQYKNEYNDYLDRYVDEWEDYSLE